jgi:hypothetical protein
MADARYLNDTQSVCLFDVTLSGDQRIQHSLNTVGKLKSNDEPSSGPERILCRR